MYPDIIEIARPSKYENGGKIDTLGHCRLRTRRIYSDSKVHVANMGPIWGRQDRVGPCWPHELCYLGYVFDWNMGKHRTACFVDKWHIHGLWVRSAPWFDLRHYRFVVFKCIFDWIEWTLGPILIAHTHTHGKSCLKRNQVYIHLHLAANRNGC